MQVSEDQSAGDIWRLLTIAIDGAMCARLLAVTLDLLPATFVASAGHAAALLKMHTRFHIWAVLAFAGSTSSRGRGIGLGLDVVLVIGYRIAIAGVVVVIFGRGMFHDHVQLEDRARLLHGGRRAEGLVLFRSTGPGLILLLSNYDCARGM